MSPEATNASIIWGYLHFLKRQTQKYTEGKLSTEDLRKSSHKGIRKIYNTAKDIRSRVDLVAQLAEAEERRREQSRARRTKSFVENNSISSSQNKEESSHTSKTPEKKESDSEHVQKPQQRSLHELLSSKYKDMMEKLLYMVHARDHVFYYLPYNGKLRVQRVGQNFSQFETVEKPKYMLHVAVHLMGYIDESVTILVSPGTTLDDIRLYICDERNWCVNTFLADFF